MASKRHLRRKVCKGKKRFSNMKDAKITIYRLKSNSILNAYYCKFCKGIHIGHAPNWFQRKSGVVHFE